MKKMNRIIVKHPYWNEGFRASLGKQKDYLDRLRYNSQFKKDYQSVKNDKMGIAKFLMKYKLRYFPNAIGENKKIMRGRIIGDSKKAWKEKGIPPKVKWKR